VDGALDKTASDESTPNPAASELITVLREARELVARPDNDFTWSSWVDADHAFREIDSLLDSVREHRAVNASVVFAPTGPMQELAMASGWSDAFLLLADRFDSAVAAYERAKTNSRYGYRCAICGGACGAITLIDDGESTEVRRSSFTSDMTCSVSGRQRSALRSALDTDDFDAILSIDVELAPFHCPSCVANYCQRHWVVWDVFDDDDPTWHDSIRGRCPQGHERMLED
jgi:hypothetical protein